jgi:hypothetical protein
MYRAGDQVCLFDGATASHLIRTCHDGMTKGESYKLMEEAYLHGVIYREVNTFGLEGRDILLA